MAMTVNIKTEKTNTEKQRLLMSLIMFWAMGSVLVLLLLLLLLFESFIFWDLKMCEEENERVLD